MPFYLTLPRCALHSRKCFAYTKGSSTMQASPTGVFMVGWEYPPHNSGGLGVACQGLTQALAEQNTQIYFTLPYKTGFSASHMEILDCGADLGVLSIAHPPFLAYQTTPISLPEMSSKISPQSYLEEQVAQYTQKVVDQALLHRNSDVIHAHDWMAFPAATKVAEKLKKPFVAQVHSTEYDRIPSGNGSNFIQQTEYEGLQAATRVIAVSYYTKELLIAKYGVPRDKISVVHNGIVPVQLSTAQSPFATKRPVVTFMGRLTMQKGTEFFLQLAQRVLMQIPNALFILAGDGDLYHELLWRVADQQLTASVLFSGFVRDKQRELLLDRSDVFVMPSVSEPFGLVALEAAQRNTPVIVSKQSGVYEAMPSALVADFWDIDLMTQQVVQLLTDTQTHQTQVVAQQSEVSRATWSRAADQVRRVYRTAFLGK
ncbi:MAG: glycosyltransferase family 4 protein [Candidatus Pacebacteria bacterium]|nr:glycosyltransferase family 4 protein [Candidatus Paceibacterota bacterium]